MFQPRGCLSDVVGRRVIIERSLLAHQGVEIMSLDVLHDQVMNPAFIVEIVDAHDVAMIEGGRGLRLEMEASQIGRVAHAVLRQHLDCHLPLHEQVFGQVDAAHAAGAKVVEQA